MKSFFWKTTKLVKLRRNSDGVNLILWKDMDKICQNEDFLNEKKQNSDEILVNVLFCKKIPTKTCESTEFHFTNKYSMTKWNPKKTLWLNINFISSKDSNK